jgi:hypothetical protein
MKAFSILPVGAFAVVHLEAGLTKWATTAPLRVRSLRGVACCEVDGASQVQPAIAVARPSAKGANALLAVLLCIYDL